MGYTTGQIIARALKNYGVPYVTGLPGHGNWSLLDAFLDDDSQLPFVQVFHEQSAVHIADAHYRATGQPIAATTSIGPGTTNTVIGLATAYADSTSLLLLTGSTATHMRNHGVMQELDRFHSPDFPAVSAAVTKRNFEMVRADEAPFLMHRAFNAMLTGRRGPVHIEIPLDVQVESADVDIAELKGRLPVGRQRADQDAIEAAVRLLVEAQRPCIVAGGGAVMSDAAPELASLVDRLGIPVVYTWNGKGAHPDDHPLNAGTAGWPGSLPGNTVAANADVVLSLGCKFTDWSASSWRKGATFSLPPGKLIQVDIDPAEIGKNYPAEVGIAADVKSALSDMLAALSPADDLRAANDREPYLDEIARLKSRWEEVLRPRRLHEGSPLTMLRVLHELRQALPRNGIVTVGSGHPQSSTKQAFPIYEPRTHITSGSFSPMGFAVPAAIGAKLAKPDTPVVCIVGDGDFMMTMQELAICAMLDLPVVFVILNNKGFISIRDGQIGLMTRQIGSEFNHVSGEEYSVDFEALARSFGFEQVHKVDRPDELAKALQRAIESNEPALVETIITRDATIAAAEVVGWWDFPLLPTAPAEARTDYATALTEEQHR
ncbi:MAG: thiamine pyrophosphate-binding protein [Acidimicrobiales bacterium]|nr:thiamine pyrophosphate-binding protein [Acidimicrobiaceae bacterium]MXV88519.1 thiamine pyrophosphate-binding protein [Acidimicrobiales bacterium]MCY3608262.1 thiamine pyrophosphate-binding protein [Acidimicrobiaceae bacterium]MDE0676715.1 thiamine pyrophosphate-binding protein [Acidimicrobiaceae bacterium]MYA83637.1 thiamine pyrophosphate-binding protein [Acidimicrobiales bacterium]